MSGGSRRTLSPAEHRVWRGFVRTIKPLRRASSLESVSEPNEPALSPPGQMSQTAAPPRVPATGPLPALAPIDRRTRQKLARGMQMIAARLDLHGMTQAQAFSALKRFLLEAQSDSLKFVLIVTGQGTRRTSAHDRDVLQRRVPQWLRLPEFRALVVGFEVAHAVHGGDGALYVRVRRPR